MMVRGRAVAGAGSPFGKAVSRTGGVTYAFTRGTVRHSAARQNRSKTISYFVLALCCFWLRFDITWCGAGLVQGRCRGDSGIPSSSDRG